MCLSKMCIIRKVIGRNKVATTWALTTEFPYVVNCHIDSHEPCTESFSVMFKRKFSIKSNQVNKLE